MTKEGALSKTHQTSLPYQFMLTLPGLTGRKYWRDVLLQVTWNYAKQCFKDQHLKLHPEAYWDQCSLCGNGITETYYVFTIVPNAHATIVWISCNFQMLLKGSPT